LFEALKLVNEPFNFKDRVSDWDAFLSEKDVELQKEALEKNLEVKQDQEGKMKEGKQIRHKMIDEKMKVLREQEKENVESKSTALRSYLIDNVIPVLTDGLIMTCKTMPDDPVDYLAEYLFKEARHFRSRQ